MGCGSSQSREYQPNGSQNITNASIGAEWSDRNGGTNNNQIPAAPAQVAANNVRQSTVRDSAVETLARSLKRATNNFNEISFGEDALQGISLAIISDSSKQVTIGHADGVAEDIVFLIKHNLKSSNICEKGIVAIKLLCRYDDDVSTSCDYNIARFGAVGACDIVAQALITHRPDISLAKQACLAIRNLALKPENSVKLGSACACEAVVRAMVTHESNPRIVEYGCWAISNLTATIVENNIALGAIGVCDAVVQAITNHGSDVHVVERACSAICNVAASAENNAKLGLSGVCEAIAYVFNTHAASADVVKSACSAVRNLAADNDNNTKLGTAGVCAGLVKAVRVHTHNASLSEQALRALVNLASGTPENGAILAEHDVVGLVMSILSAHLNDAAVAEYGCWALSNVVASYSSNNSTPSSINATATASATAGAASSSSAGSSSSGENVAPNKRDRRKQQQLDATAAAVGPLCELLVRVMRAHESKPNVIEKGSCAVSKIVSSYYGSDSDGGGGGAAAEGTSSNSTGYSSNGNCNAAAAKLLVDFGVIEILVPSLKSHEFHSAVLFQICQALQELLKKQPPPSAAAVAAHQPSASRRVLECGGWGALHAISDDTSLHVSVRTAANETLHLLRKT